MEHGEVFRLFDLLDKLYSRKKISRDEITVAIWHQVLKPWTYHQVREAVLVRSRENQYLPDPSELGAYLPPLPPAIAPVVVESRYEEYINDLAKLGIPFGLPPLREALAGGMELGEWMGDLRRAVRGFEGG